jgi:hypothetical protein
MTRLRRDAPAKLTLDQELELLCGPLIGPNWPNDGGTPMFRPERSNFASEEERRAAWEANRERLIDYAPGWTGPGRRSTTSRRLTVTSPSTEHSRLYASPLPRSEPCSPRRGASSLRLRCELTGYAG